MALSRRPIRHRPAAAAATDGPRLLPGADTSTARAAGPGPRWSFAARARTLRLSPQMVEQDLRDLGVDVPHLRLRRIMVGVEPATPEVLTALVDVLQLRDLALVDEQVIATATAAWPAAGQRVPPRVLDILAAARNMPAQQVLATVVRARGHRP